MAQTALWIIIMSKHPAKHPELKPWDNNLLGLTMLKHCNVSYVLYVMLRL